MRRKKEERGRSSRPIRKERGGKWKITKRGK